MFRLLRPVYCCTTSSQGEFRMRHEEQGRSSSHYYFHPALAGQRFRSESLMDVLFGGQADSLYNVGLGDLNKFLASS